MILLIDNYDSFSNNLYQLVGELSPGPGRPETAPVARYHSLAADPATVPPELKVTALTREGEIMAVQHKTCPIFGVQFHPESIMTPDGKQMLKNFIKEL